MSQTFFSDKDQSETSERQSRSDSDSTYDLRGTNDTNSQGMEELYPHSSSVELGGLVERQFQTEAQKAEEKMLESMEAITASDARGVSSFSQPVGDRQRRAPGYFLASNEKEKSLSDYELSHMILREITQALSFVISNKEMEGYLACESLIKTLSRYAKVMIYVVILVFISLSTSITCVTCTHVISSSIPHKYFYT